MKMPHQGYPMVQGVEKIPRENFDQVIVEKYIKDRSAPCTEIDLRWQRREENPLS
jgi:hypothetical protein